MKIVFCETTIFIIILSILTVEIEPGVSPLTVRGRSHSIGARPIDFKPIERPNSQSESILSISSKHEEVMEAKPSSTATEIKEIDIRDEQHLIERPSRVNFAAGADLTEALTPTNSGPEHLNPERDGFFARVSRIVFPAAAAGVAVGAAIGVGVEKIINANTSSVQASNNSIDFDVNGLITIFN